MGGNGADERALLDEVEGGADAGRGGAGPLTPGELRDRVGEVVGDIPPGRTMSYGDIADIVGTGPRQVGRVLATADRGWPWWRVTRSNGTLPDSLQPEALRRYEQEGTPVRGGHADRRNSRWDPWEGEL